MNSSDREIPRFFGLTFLWSWVFFTVATLQFRAHGLDGAPWWALTALLAGAYGPTIVAVGSTARAGGGPSVRRLLGGFLRWRGAGGAHLAALALLPALRLGGAALFVLFGGGSVSFDASRAHLIPVALVAALPFGPMAEEVGWRGYAQPRLLERRSPLWTGAILGTAWTAWHIPLFFSPVGTSISGQPVTLSSVSFYWSLLVGLSILIVWLSLRHGTHLLTGLLIHVGFNAEILRFLISVPEGGLDPIEPWALIPIWLAVAGLFLTGRLGSTPRRRG